MERGFDEEVDKGTREKSALVSKGLEIVMHSLLLQTNHPSPMGTHGKSHRKDPLA
jgi:hypothetical protein